MVVVPEPSVKGCGALLAVAVDRAVCPAAEHGADEALGLPVCLRAVGAGAEVADAERAAGHGVSDREIRGAVIGDELLDLDPVAAVEGSCAAQERDRGARLLVWEDFCVGQARAVIDRDMYVLPADYLAACARAI
jgi:hypothetical protein